MDQSSSSGDEEKAGQAKGEPMDTEIEVEGQPLSSRSCGNRRQVSTYSEVPPDEFQIILERIDGLQDVQNEQSDRLTAIQD